MKTLKSLQGARFSFGQRRLEAGGHQIDAPAPVSSERRFTRLEPMDVYCAFVAPIRGGAGPYLAFYFASYHHFSAACIGLLLGAMTLAFGLCQIPAGLIVDRFSCRKQIAILVLVAVAWSLSVTGNFGEFPVLLGAQILMGMACSFFGPLAASFSVGLVDRQQLNLRLGRNEISCHTGNIITGILLGVGLHLAD
ncbi:MAG TPA: MFS transporter, partial [Chroococcales cyanobacterium]